MKNKNILGTAFLFILILNVCSCGRKGDIKRISNEDSAIVPAKIDNKKTYKY